MPENLEKFNQDPAEKWSLSKEPTIEIIKSLEGALAEKNPDKVKEIISDSGKVRKLIIDRQQKGKGVIEIKSSFDLLFQEKFGPEADIFSAESDEILNWMKEIDLPEHVLAEMTDVAYHFKENKLFLRLISIVEENEERIESKTVIANVLHNLATWENMVEKNPEKSKVINKKAIEKAREAGDVILETKASYGLTHNKDLVPKKKIEDYEKYIEKFRESGNEADALRAMNEAAGAYLALAKNQKKSQKELYFENLDKAKFLAEESLKEAEKIGYSNASIKIYRNLNEIYREMGKHKEANEHLEEANKLKRETGYRY